MSDITYEHIKAIAKLENDVKERDATIKELQESNEGIKQTNIEAYDRVKQLQEDNQRLKSTLNTICLAWKRGDNYEFYEDLIEKHKLIEP
jgi:uncharacterized protein YoxC